LLLWTYSGIPPRQSSIVELYMPPRVHSFLRCLPLLAIVKAVGKDFYQFQERTDQCQVSLDCQSTWFIYIRFQVICSFVVDSHAPFALLLSDCVSEILVIHLTLQLSLYYLFSFLISLYVSTTLAAYIQDGFFWWGSHRVIL
jgi:hypothetical protein